MQTFTPSKSLSRRVAIRQGRRGVAARAADVAKIERTKVPLELEEGDMPLNTFTPKKPFKAKIKSVTRIVGPKVRPPAALIPPPVLDPPTSGCAGQPRQCAHTHGDA